MKNQPKSEYRWTNDWREHGNTWRLAIRDTGQIVGRVVRNDLDDGSTAHEGLVWANNDWLSIGFYGHWTAAKRAVQAAYTGIRLHEAARV